MRTSWLNRLALLTTIALFVAVSVLAETKNPEHGHHGAKMAGQTQEDADQTVVEQTLCPITGNPIKQDVSIDYQGQRIYFCCAGCDKTFLENPEGHLAEMAEQGVIVESLQTVCPVSGEELKNKDTYVDYKGRRIYFCCPGCDKDFAKDPEKYLSQIK